jgi:polysaccharide biosynthesis/export protein
MAKSKAMTFSTVRFFVRGVLASGLVFPLAMCLGQTQKDIQLPDMLSMRPDLKQQTKASFEGKTVPLDGPVQAEEYYVGPGDLLSVNIWSSVPVEHQLTVTPEGFLLIPSVGSVDLALTTLSAAREKVSKEVGRKYPKSQVTVSLLAPRKLLVQVTGQVMNEGPQEVYAVQRVDRLIEIANTLPSTQITKEFYDHDLQKLRRARSQRFISLLHRDGTTQRVDLVRYLLTGNGKWNPYLREGDVVHVPERSDVDNRIGIYGGVIRPGGLEWVAGDSLLDLIHLGMGFNPLSVPASAILTRLSESASRMDTVRLDIKAILEGGAANIALLPGDRLVVTQSRDYREGNSVRVEGEVLRPGTYPITPYSTKLSEIVHMAGGFTPTANLRGATLARARVSPMDLDAEVEREHGLAMRASLSFEDTTYYLTEASYRIKGGVVSVDFLKLFAERDTSRDVTLRNYDQIVVPPMSHTVYVFGQVISPGHVPLVEGANAKYYIDQAGGFTGEARSGDMKIIKGSNRIWLDPDETIIEDGDGLWVPKTIERPFTYYLSTYSQVAGILATAASLAILIANMK